MTEGEQVQVALVDLHRDQLRSRRRAGEPSAPLAACTTSPRSTRKSVMDQRAAGAVMRALPSRAAAVATDACACDSSLSASAFPFAAPVAAARRVASALRHWASASATPLLASSSAACPMKPVSNRSRWRWNCDRALSRIGLRLAQTLLGSPAAAALAHRSQARLRLRHVEPAWRSADSSSAPSSSTRIWRRPPPAPRRPVRPRRLPVIWGRRCRPGVAPRRDRWRRRSGRSRAVRPSAGSPQDKHQPGANHARALPRRRAGPAARPNAAASTAMRRAPCSMSPPHARRRRLLRYRLSRPRRRVGAARQPCLTAVKPADGCRPRLQRPGRCGYLVATMPRSRRPSPPG